MINILYLSCKLNKLMEVIMESRTIRNAYIQSQWILEILYVAFCIAFEMQIYKLLYEVLGNN